jgi:hypothetical protein
MTLHNPRARLAIEWLIVRGQIRKMMRAFW